MELPDGFRFTEDHEWAREEDDQTITVGITDHAQDQLGELVYVELPHDGDEVVAGEEFAVVESTKAASEVYAPVSGTVVEVNDLLLDDPGAVNDAPYEDGWLIRIEPDDPAEFDGLMDVEAYETFLTEDA